MSREIEIHRYVLHSRRGLNARSDATEHEGCLIKVRFENETTGNHTVGYGCLHPWEELGDPSIDELIGQLCEGRMSRQVRNALECAEVDAAARAKGVSLFDGLEVPKSNATIVGGMERVVEAVEQGFDCLKLKAGRDTESELQLLHGAYERYPELRWRLDFNGVMGSGAIEAFVQDLGEDLLRQIDYLEDPCSLGSGAWKSLRKRYALKLAVDYGISKTKGRYDQFDVSIVKPAINDVEKICSQASVSGRRVVVTSYLDHPLGQCYAAYCAGLMNQQFLGLVRSRCGLMTHGLYEPNAFSERLGEPSPSWRSPGGTGLGFDDLLESLQWSHCYR